MPRLALITTTDGDLPQLHVWAECLRPSDVIVIAGSSSAPGVTALRARSLVGDVPVVFLEGGGHWAGWIPDVGPDRAPLRNAALLEAIALDADAVLEVAPSVFPELPGRWFGDEIASVLMRDERRGARWNALDSPTGWHNPGALYDPQHVSRGHPDTPWEQHGVPSFNVHRGSIGLLSLPCLGGPDVSALEQHALRHRGALEIEDWHSQGPTVLAPGTWAPISGRALAYRSELAPAMAWPLGSVVQGDLCAGWVVQKVIEQRKWLVQIGSPLVRDSPKNDGIEARLAAEFDSHQVNHAISRTLRSVHLSNNDLDSDIGSCHRALSQATGTALLGPWLIALAYARNRAAEAKEQALAQS